MMYQHIIMLFSKLLNHNKKSCPFPPPHIVTIVWVYCISTTFGHLKFANGLLHSLMFNIIHSCYIHYVVHLWV
jgi:hypothetical protein